jgi:hypothetical protein
VLGEKRVSTLAGNHQLEYSVGTAEKNKKHVKDRSYDPPNFQRLLHHEVSAYNWVGDSSFPMLDDFSDRTEGRVFLESAILKKAVG